MRLLDWPLCVACVFGIGVFLRRLLKLTPPRPVPPVPHNYDRDRLCEAVELIFERELAILSVLLNDVIEAYVLEKPQIARELLHLALSQWDSLSGTLLAFLNEIVRYVPTARLTSVPRAMTEHFRSGAMLDYARLHKRLSPFVFRTKPRFTLHVRILGEAVKALTADFKISVSECSMPASSAAVCDRVDRDFHDFDIVAKKLLLTLRLFSTCLPQRAFEDFAADVQPLLRPSLKPIAA